jgi:hypothetical protein
VAVAREIGWLIERLAWLQIVAGVQNKAAGAIRRPLRSRERTSCRTPANVRL